MVTKKTPKVVLTAVAIVIAAYILSPFYLVLINTFKNANGIVANPVSFAGASFAQFKTNICDHYSCFPCITCFIRRYGCMGYLP